MMRSMFSGVSGLRNHQIRMDIIGDNIANVNTVGYKASRVNFQELFSQTIRGASAPTEAGRGGTNPVQVGLGMGIAAISSVHTPGNLQVTEKMTDLAIQGSGFFMVSDGQGTYLTRDGSFDLDAQGYLVNAAGLKVQGWMAGSNGTFPVKDQAHLSDIRIPVGNTIAAQATTRMGFANNLDARSAIGDKYTIVPDVYDSLGNSHSIILTFEKTAENVWTWTASLSSAITVAGENVGTGDGSTTTFALDYLPVPGSLEVYVDGDGSGPNPPVLQNPGTDYTVDYSTGEITFATAPASGAVITANYQYTLAGSGTVSFNTDGSYKTGGGTIKFDPTSPDANPVSVTLDFTRVTQYASPNTVSWAERNGYPMGSLEQYTIDDTGTITGVYSNGLTQSIAQVALVSFSNPVGLTRIGENLFVQSNNSGLPQVGEPGTGGRGKIAPGSLEMSNVDLSREFTDMIITQRGFQANSRVITTSDEMLQELVNLKR